MTEIPLHYLLAEANYPHFKHRYKEDRIMYSLQRGIGAGYYYYARTGIRHDLIADGHYYYAKLHRVNYTVRIKRK